MKLSLFSTISRSAVIGLVASLALGGSFYSTSAEAKTEIKAPEEAQVLPQDEETPPPNIRFGKEGARENFKRVRRTPASDLDHYLNIQIGGFVQSEAWRWGNEPSKEGPGRMTVGVTYRMDEWNKMDLLIRGDFATFRLSDGDATKFSFLGTLIFPEASSRFPLYFGTAFGPGVFFRQLPNESPLSLDYQLFAGARFFDVFEGIGFTLEGGWKNHLNLVSDGQMNGSFVSLGMVFTF